MIFFLKKKYFFLTQKCNPWVVPFLTDDRGCSLETTRMEIEVEEGIVASCIDRIFFSE